MKVAWFSAGATSAITCYLALQEDAELKETIQELNKAIQDCNIQRTRLYKALEEIRDMFLNQVAWCGQLTPFEEKIYKIINEVLENE